MKWAPEREESLIGKRIRRRRQELGFTQTQLGSLTGVTYQQIQKYERGDNRISGGMLYRAAKAMRCPIPYFYEDLPDPVTHAPPIVERPVQDIDADLQAVLKMMTRKNRRLLLTIAEALCAQKPAEGMDPDDPPLERKLARRH